MTDMHFTRGGPGSTGLDAIIAATGQHEANKAAGTTGDKIEVTCPDCGWHAWSYRAYMTGNEVDARGWLLAQHQCAMQHNV
jgi:hypothetical protein